MKNKQLIPNLIASVLLVASIAVAQKPATEDSSPQNDVTNQERARRIDTPPAAPVASQVSEGQANHENNVDAEILSLQEQIDLVTNSEDKVVLQFKLVDRFIQKGMRQEALSQLILMSQEDRFDPQGFYNIGNALVRLGNTDEAVRSYRKAIDQKKGRYSRALNNLGVVLLRQARWDEAFEALISALRLENFRYAEASYNLGRLYSVRGETDLAIREWRRALAVDPEHNAAGQAILASRPRSEIAVVLHRAKQPVTDATTGRAFPRKGSVRPPRPGSATMPVLTVDPETFDLLQRARTARERGRNEDAAQYYQRVIARMDGYFPPANLELSYTLINLKRNDEALASLLLLTQKDGDQYPISHYHLGRLYELKGEFKLAEECYSKAVALYSDDNAGFLLDVSRVREKLGDFSGALKAMEEYVVLMEKQGHKPDWSEQRLTQLRQQVSSNQLTPKN